LQVVSSLSDLGSEVLDHVRLDLVDEMLLQLSVCFKAMLRTEVKRQLFSYVALPHLNLPYRILVVSTSVNVNAEDQVRLYLRLRLLTRTGLNHLRDNLLHELASEVLIDIAFHQL